MGLIDILLITVAILNVVLGSILLLKKRSGASFFFGSAVYGVALWNLSMALFRILDSPMAIIFWAKTLYIAAIIIASGFLYFSYTFSKRKLSNYTKWGFAIPPLIIFGIIIWPGAFIKEVIIHSGYYRTVSFNGLYLAYVFFVIGYFSLAFWNLAKIYRKHVGLVRHQLHYVFIGTSISTIIGVIADLILPWLGYFQAYWVGPVFSLIMVVFVVYAIARYRLMDIRIATKKGIIYLFIAAFAYGAFYLVTWIENSLFGSVHARNSFIIGVFISIVFAVSLFFFEKSVRLVTNKYLFVSLRSQQETLRGLNKKLTSILDLDILAGTITETIKKTLSLEKIALLLRQKKSRVYGLRKNSGFKEDMILSLTKNNNLIDHLEKTEKPLLYEELNQSGLRDIRGDIKKAGVSLLLPLVFKKELLGVIALDEKNSGEAYTKEELELLETLAIQISLAIENSSLYEHIKDLNDNLKDKVKEQTKNITELLKMKSEFLDTASHQLRTPTSIFRGMLSLLKEKGENFSAQEKDLIQDAELAALRLGNIITGIMEANELQGGLRSISFEPTDLARLIEEIIPDFRDKAQAKNLSLVFEKPTTKLIPILGSRAFLKSALEKLLDNAIAYTETGQVAISLIYNEHDKATVKDDTVSITVKDTGIGLTPEDKQILFQQFSRGRGAKLIDPNTSGLGLYIVKKVAELHHGDIKAQSDGENKGSIFILTLPVIQRI